MSSNQISTKSSIKWAGLGQASRVFTQLCGLLVLARLLPPEDFGLMALAGTVTAFASLFRDMGSGAALIQIEYLTKELKNAIYFFNLSLGALLTITLLCSADPLSEFFQQPKLKQVLVTLSPVFFIISISTTHLALLERESSYKQIALINIASSIIGLGIAVYMAVSGAGVYALVAQSLGTATITSILLWVTVRYMPSLSFSFKVLKEIFSFSSNLFIFNALNYFHRNLDSMLIGRFLGTHDLGIYNIAYKILLFPLHNITFVISRVMFPAYSRVQNDNPIIAEHYLRTLKVIAFITAPMMAGVWYFREPLVLVFLGINWLPAADVLGWLAPVGFFQSLNSTSGAVLKAKGRTDILRNLGFIGVPFLTLSFFVGLPWGIEGIAASYCVANFIWIYPVMKKTLEVLDTSFKCFLLPIAMTTIVAILAISITLFLDNTFRFIHETNSLVYLMLGMMFYITVYLLFSMSLDKKTAVLVWKVLRNNDEVLAK